MEVFHTSFEAHARSLTIYVVGFLCDDAVARALELMVGAPADVRVIRVDLRAVSYIDPHAFVVMSRTLSRWRETHGGRVTIHFPKRSTSRASRHLRLVDQPTANGLAISPAMSWPMSTSPG